MRCSPRLPLSLLSVLTLHTLSASAFYLPGVAPTSYSDGAAVPLNVNRITPLLSAADHQLRSTVSYDYYLPEFHFCQPKDGPQDVGPESLGAVIFGDRIKTSPFELHMKKNEACKKLCETRFNGPDAKFVEGSIAEDYHINWLVDGLPAGRPYFIGDNDKEYFTRGVPIGRMAPPEFTTFLHNHYDMVISYHTQKDGKHRVVGVIVEPSSRALAGQGADCGETGPPLKLNLDGETTVAWTYSVYWVESKIAWASRWDMLLTVEDPSIHWFSIVNSAVIVIFLTGTVSAILMRALKRDFARYNRLDTFNLDDFSANDNVDEGIQEDSGWKLVHGDVFRPPPNALLLSIFLGNGAQLFCMTGVTIAFALLGFLSPSNRGALGTAILILYILFGFIGGYVSSRMYKTFGGDAWKRNIVMTPVMAPAIVFGVFFLLNLFLWARQSSGAVPFSTMLVLVGIWFLISVPLSFAGSWVGFKQQPFSSPVRTNQIPRQIPPASSYLRPLPSLLLVGVLPFGAIFVELYFIMNSLWFDRVYYMFGFLFLCYGIMIITCAAVTIMFVYYLLCSENYRWQWRAFNSAGAGAIFVFLFAMIYYLLSLRFSGFTSMVLYFGYSALISFLFFILTGMFVLNGF
jgi:transmembrane 9 superfamily protein 2/4